MENGPYKRSLEDTGENQCKVHGVTVNHLGLTVRRQVRFLPHPQTARVAQRTRAAAF
jgi:hypothetical protein